MSSRKEESLEGLKLLVLGAAGPDGELTGATVVAVDAVGAGEGLDGAGRRMVQSG